MKLKEKLADECCNFHILVSTDGGPVLTARAAYLKGFEMARELALDKIKDCLEMGERWKFILHCVNDIGEQEV